MSNDKDINDKDIIEFAKRNLAATALKVGDRTFIVHGRELSASDMTEKLEEMLPQPRFKRGDFKFGTLADLTEFAKTHKLGDAKKERSGGNSVTQAFISLSTGSILTVIDGHGPGAQEQAWGHCKASYAPKFSDQWNAWTVSRNFNTAELAAFLDDHVEDVGLGPVAGKDATEVDRRHNELAKLYGAVFGSREELMATSRGIRINVKERMAQTVNTNSGEIELEYTAEHTGTGGGKLKIPGLFMLNIPVFEGGAIYRLPTRLMYRVKDGAIVWAFKVLQADTARRTAITDMRDKLKSEAAIPVYFSP